MQYRRSPAGSTSRVVNVALRTAIGLGLAGAAVLFSSSAQAQAARFPFPSTNLTAPKSSVLTSHEIRARYEEWKATFIDDCGDGSMTLSYLENNPPDTRSEGIGYGMVIAAYMGDKPVFDGLWNYYQRFSNNGLMTWRTSICGGSGDSGSAADADVDAAMGLIIADRQWGGRATEASQLINAIQTQEFLNCNGRRLLDPGSDEGFGNCTCMNPSYFAPGYYRVFAEYADAAFWNEAAADAYETLNDVQNGQTGLVPAWSSATQVQINNCTFQVEGGGAANEYQSDAARTPWRIATDLAWSNSQEARNFLGPMFNWVTTQNPIAHIYGTYSLGGQVTTDNGTPGTADGDRSTITMGGFATAGIVAADPNAFDRITGAWQSLYTAGDAGHAFNISLQLLYGLLITGNMWDPAGPDPVAQVEPTRVPPAEGNVLTNGDFDEGLLGWNMEIYGDGTAQAYAMHRDGELNVDIQGIDEFEYNIVLFQEVSVQAGERYLMRFRGRAAEPRRIRLIVQQEGTDDVFGSLGNGEEVTMGTEFATYEWVFESSGTEPQARLKFQFGDSAAGVTIDDVVFQPTQLPISEGEPVVPSDPNNPGDPTNPGTPGTPGGNNDGTTPLGNGDGPVIPNQGDNTGGPGAPIPGGETGGLPAPPAGSPGGNGTCTTDANCGGFLCNPTLGLCYEPQFGYVWDQSLNGGQGGWAQPPPHNCGAGYVFWPLVNLCYDPETGYVYNTTTMRWEYYGDQYTQGQDDAGGSDSACGITTSAPSGQSTPWFALGLLGLAVGLRRRRV